MKGARHAHAAGAQAAALRAAEKHAEELRHRMTNEHAQASGRCLCQGCAACRGEPGYPCGWLLTSDVSTSCRYCYPTGKRQ